MKAGGVHTTIFLWKDMPTVREGGVQEASRRHRPALPKAETITCTHVGFVQSMAGKRCVQLQSAMQLLNLVEFAKHGVVN